MFFTRMWENFKPKMDVWDYACVKLSCVAFGIFLAALVPAFLNLNAVWWLAIAVVLAIKPVSTFFRKESF